MRVTICADVKEGKREIVDAWLERWSSELTTVSENNGCGCCVDLWNVDGPPEAFVDLPSSVIAWSEWTDIRVRNIFSGERMPDPWEPADDRAAELERELALELPADHALSGKSVRAVARRFDEPDALFEISGGPLMAEVRLTWSGGTEQAPLPVAKLFHSRENWALSKLTGDDDKDSWALVSSP